LFFFVLFFCWEKSRVTPWVALDLSCRFEKTGGLDAGDLSLLWVERSRVTPYMSGKKSRVSLLVRRRRRRPPWAALRCSHEWTYLGLSSESYPRPVRREARRGSYPILGHGRSYLRLEGRELPYLSALG
jgi:hypothetical protein